MPRTFEKCRGKLRGQFWLQGAQELLSGSRVLAGWHRATWRNQVGMDASVDPEADSSGGVWDFLN